MVVFGKKETKKERKKSELGRTERKGKEKRIKELLELALAPFKAEEENQSEK